MGGEIEKMRFDLTVSGAEQLYSTASGAGFVTEENRSAEELLRIPEINSGFVPVFWHADAHISKIVRDSRGCTLDSSAYPADAQGRYIPLCYKADVSGCGNYRVTIHIDNTLGTDTETLIYLSRRRLYFRGMIHAGENFTQSYDVNVCDFIPRGRTEVYAGRSVDIAVVSTQPRLTGVSIERLDAPAVWIAGDSTLTDQTADYPYHPSTSYSGWGQMLSNFLLPGIVVSNHAHSGLSTHTFREEGHYAIVKQYMRSGDYLFLQFGHNDQKQDFLRAEGGYRERLTQYCSEARAAGVHPILVTPLARNSWKEGGGEYNDLLRDYDMECKKLGLMLEIPVLQLHDYFMMLICKEGLEAAKRYFYPGDFTHTNDQGAYLAASFIAGELKKLTGVGYRYLAAHIGSTDAKWQTEAVEPLSPPADFTLNDRF